MKHKERIGRKILSWLLMLAMVVGMMPQMSVPVKADGDETFSVAKMQLTSGDVGISMPQFKATDSETAAKWSGAPQSGTAYLIYAAYISSNSYQHMNDSYSYCEFQDGTYIGVGSKKRDAMKEAITIATVYYTTAADAKVTIQYNLLSGETYKDTREIGEYIAPAYDSFETVPAGKKFLYWYSGNRYFYPEKVRGYYLNEESYELSPNFEYIPYKVTVSGGGNATANGNLTQTKNIDTEMTPVTFTANDKYHFADFDPVTVNGITMEKTSDTQVTVSGKPSGDVNMEVPAAVRITYDITVTGGAAKVGGEVVTKAAQDDEVTIEAPISGGESFIKWETKDTIEGLDTTENPAIFSMPAHAVALTADVRNAESMMTNKSKTEYKGQYFDVTCDSVGGENGMEVNESRFVTITAHDCILINRIELTMAGQWASYGDQLRVKNGAGVDLFETKSNKGVVVAFDNIDSDKYDYKFQISSSLLDYLNIQEIKVYFDELTPSASITKGDITTQYSSFEDAIGAWEGGSTLKLLNNVTYGTTIQVSKGKTLDLNGYGITHTGAGSVIQVTKGGTLTLMDSRPEETTYQYSVSDGLATLNESGEFSFKGGYITGGKGSNLAGKSSYALLGGGIHVKAGGTLVMTGGTIIGNTAQKGGGISVVCGDNSGADATFEMSGGRVIYNSATQYGGGIFGSVGITDNGKNYTVTLTIKGNAEITNNKAGTSGGGVSADQPYVKVNLSDSPKIVGNKAGTADQNVYLKDQLLNSVDQLTDGARIGITRDTTENKYAFIKSTTMTFTDETAAQYFFSDKAAYGVYAEDGQAKLMKAFQVSFDANGATSGSCPQAQKVAYGRTVTVPGNTGSLVKDGYAFLGWATSKNATAAEYTDGSTFNVSANVTLYAVWERTTKYSVTLTGGANATATPATGTTQTGLTGAMTTVTYTANSGYHFEAFSDIRNNGVTVTRISDTVVKVSGTPTADASIEVPGAVSDAVSTVAVSILKYGQGSGTYSLDSVEKLFDRSDAAWISVSEGIGVYGNRDCDWVSFQSKSGMPFIMSSYILRTCDWDEEDELASWNWKSWRIFGSNNDNAKTYTVSFSNHVPTIDTTIWTLVQEVKDDSSLQAGCSDFSFSIANNDAFYKYYLLIIDDIRSTDDNIQAMTEMTVKGLMANPSVTLTGGANATRSGGDAIQSDLTGTMTTVTYMADSGYHFEEFSDITNNGITAKRTSIKVVTVSGMPTADASITIPNAVADTKVEVSILNYGQGKNTASFESANKLFDGFDNKWCSVTNRIGAYGNRDCDWVTFQSKSGMSFIMSSYILRTGGDSANDNGARNWKSWRIYGSNNDDAATYTLSFSDHVPTIDTGLWTLVQAVIDDSILRAQNLTDFTFNISNNYVSYKYYLLIIDDICSTNDNVQQMAEMTIKGAMGESEVDTNPSVTLFGGAHATRSGGASTQYGLIGAMTTVTYTADSGYHFEEFSDITKNGITITRTSSTVVTVSGTPTANVSITIPNAVSDTMPDTMFTVAVSILKYGQGSSTNSDESATKLFNGNNTDKWCSLISGNGAYSNRDCDWVSFKSKSGMPFVMSSYILRTGSDSASGNGARNWKSWRIFGSNNDNAMTYTVSFNNHVPAIDTDLWTLVQQVENDSILQAQNNTDFTFNISNNHTSYKYYLLIIDDICSTNDNAQQMAEMTIMGSMDGNETGTKSVILTGGANATQSGGNATQKDLTGAMTTVTYTANSGYSFDAFSDITINGITVTRTSSTVVTVSGTPTAYTCITIPDAKWITYSVTLTGGANATRSGSASQSGLTGAMTTVTYTANTGYQFEKFSDITNNGITATRTNSTKITVSGTPTADVSITIPDAVIVEAVDNECLTNETSGKLKGTYYLNSDVTLSEGIILLDGTIINGNGYSITCQKGTVITVESGIVTLNGLTIKDARSGRALNLKSGTAAILKNCVIKDNAYQSAAIYLYNAQLVLDNCLVSGNETTSSSFCGTIEIGSGSTLYAIESAIQNNIAGRSTGGVNNTYCKAVYLMKCRITGNSTPGSNAATSDGGALRNGSNVYAANCVITGNKSGSDTYFDIPDAPYLKNCIYGNVSSDANMTGSTQGTDVNSALPSAPAYYSYSIKDGKLVVKMSYQDDNGEQQPLGELEKPAGISATVTFKVVGGSWNEGEGDAATADKTVTLEASLGETMKLTASQIPAVGNKPNDSYTKGSWDVVPSTDTEITGDITYTYTYQVALASITKNGSTTLYSTFKNALNAWTVGSTLKLLDNVTYDTTIAVSNSKTLDLNGYGITHKGEGSVIQVTKGYTLTLMDSRPDATTYQYSVSNGLATLAENGEYSFKGGYITGGKGSRLAGNSSYALQGGGIHIKAGGKLVMTGGTIIGNTATKGGGISVVCKDNNDANATCEISGGRVIYNTATQYGGGVFGSIGLKGSTKTVTITIKGNTEISNNKAGSSGGGVSADQSCIKMNLSGSPKIIDNKVGNATQNVFLSDNVFNSVGQLTDGARIGVTRGTSANKYALFNTTSITFTDETAAQYFFSDKAGYGVYAEDGQAKLIKEYQVSFDANGATSGSCPEAQKVAYGRTFTVPGNTGSLEKEGYEFLGWATSQNATAAEYTAGSTFNMGAANVTLYAVWKKVYTVAARTRLKTSDTSVGNVTISNTAPYLEGDSIVLTAPDKSSEGYQFLGWFNEDVPEFSNENQKAATLRYEFVLKADTNVVAVYEARGSVDVKIVAVNGAEYTVDGSNEVLQDDSTVTKRRGSTLTLHAQDANKVLQWQNASGKVLGTGADLTITVTGAMEITLVYNSVEQNQSNLQFVSDYGQVLYFAQITNSTAITFPAPPSKPGYNFVKWVIGDTDTEATADNIKAKVGIESLITIKPCYTKDNTTYKVTVNYRNAADESIGEESKDYADIRVGTSRTFTAPVIAGYKFQCWKNGDQVLGYDTSYVMKVMGNVTLTACYVAENVVVVALPTITLCKPYCTVAGDVHKITCIATRDVPEGYTLVEQGMLYARDVDGLNESNFVIDSTIENIKRGVSSDKALKGTLTVNIKTVGEGDTWKSIKVSFRGYMILRDNATGNETCYYTGIEEASYNTLNPQD